MCESHSNLVVMAKSDLNINLLIMTSLHDRNRTVNHDDVIKWNHFPRYWLFVRGIHQSPVNSPHKGQWRGALMFSLICAGINGWVNNREACDLERYRAHYDVIVMWCINAITLDNAYIRRAVKPCMDISESPIDFVYIHRPQKVYEH